MTLVEYADLQCPYCAQWARETLPVLVDEYVETGKLRIVFHGLAFIGPDSDKALRTAIAAGQDDQLWDIVHGLYASQGAENSGWVSDGLVGEIVSGVPGLDGEKLLSARWGSSVTLEMKRAAAAATRAGVHGTPAFQIGPTGGRLELVEVSSLGPDGIRPRSRRCWRDERARAPARKRRARCSRRGDHRLSALRSPQRWRLVCSTGGCETVQSSSYAEVLGVPVAALGLVGYLGLLLAALARGEWARLSQVTLALTGFLFSAYLLYVQFAVIDAICQWCVATDVLTTAIVALALLRLGSAARLRSASLRSKPSSGRVVRVKV